MEVVFNSSAVATPDPSWERQAFLNQIIRYAEQPLDVVSPIILDDLHGCQVYM